MSLVAFVSGRSPGLTTAVHAVAAAWPQPGRAVVAELDAAGGTLAARHELPPVPGLTDLAVAGRRGMGPETVLQHCRRLPTGVIALVAPVNPEQVASALTVLGPHLGPALDTIAGTEVLADCGRIDRRSPVMDLVRGAAIAVLVVAPSVEGVAYAHARLEMLSPSPGRLAVVTVGDRPYRADEVGAALGLPVVGSLAHDPAGAAALNGAKAWRRSDLFRTASAIARQLASVLATIAASAEPAEPADPPAQRAAAPNRAAPPAEPAPGRATPLADLPPASDRPGRPRAQPAATGPWIRQ